MLGLSLSHNRPVESMPAVAQKLFCCDNGENKFLESMVVWLDITAPRFWWSQADTYRSGITKQSGSTMHSILKRELTQGDFEQPISDETLKHINLAIFAKFLDTVKNELPEGYLQRRVVCTNYKTLRNMVFQRANHRLKQWHIFIDALKSLEHPEFLGL